MGIERVTVSRRSVLRAALSGFVLAGAKTAFAGTFAVDRVRYLSACMTFGGEHRFAAFTVEGERVFETALPGRGHGCCVRPGGSEAAVFARRPGTFLAVVDFVAGEAIRTIQSPPGRHFCEHGAFSPDGRLLYATENAFDQGRGVIGIYDASEGYRRLGEIPSHGVGPHEVKMLPDGETLAVANGGIRTHPASGREKLNLDTMAPSLAYIDRRSGTLLELAELSPEWHRNSIRHLDIAEDGRVVAGLQFQGRKDHTAPLVMTHRRGAAPRLLTAPANIQQDMRNYCGSICIDPSGTLAAASAPRGGLTVFWDLAAGTYAGHVSMIDGCGVAATREDGTFVVSSGAGGAARISAVASETLDDPYLRSRRWDNHLTAVI